MSEELRECPFCGGEVTVALGGDEERGFYFITRGIKENRCDCRVFMESERFYHDEDKEVKEKAKIDLIKRWNRRICQCRKVDNKCS